MKSILTIIFFVFAFGTFSFGQHIIIRNITIEGNEITKSQIILRELTFAKSDTIKKQDWENARKQSEENLINLSLFHTVEISFNSIESPQDVVIKVTERWYLWPIPQIDIDERNFNAWLQSKSLERASAGIMLTHNNMRGQGEILKLLVMMGYNQQLGMSYEFPSINRNRTFGIGFQSIYTMSHEVNAKTEYDKQVYLKTENEPIRKDWLSAIQFQYRPKHYLSHLFQLRYHQWQFADTLVKFNPKYSPHSITDLKYFGFYYKLKIDHRDYQPYPLTGYYVDLEINKYGMGLYQNELNILSFKSTIRKYLQISDRWFFALGVIAKMSNNEVQPYLLERGLGFGRDFVRGYEYYVVNGQDYVVGKSNIKFELIPKKVVKLNWIKSPKFNTIPFTFYLNLFSDIGIVNNSQFNSPTNVLPNTFLYSGGIGLDFVSYYDAVARFEWAMNAKGESHFYLHFIAPI